jgi:transposase
MAVDTSTLPNDTEELKAIIADLEASYQRLEKESEKKIEILEEQINYFKDKLYGRSSERFSEAELAQIRLFNEAELGSTVEQKEEGPAEGIEVASYKRKKRGRKPLPADLPREEIIHDISEEEKLCGCGKPLTRIGEVSNEKLAYEPARVWVKKHIRYKYACRGCDGVETEGGAVKVAQAPAQLLPKSIATPSLLASIITSKFCDALPFYRQEKIFYRMGIELSRATMCNWAIALGEKVSPLIRLLKDDIRNGRYVQSDETPVQVLEEIGREAKQKSYMWVFRGGKNRRKPSIVYEYHPSRSGDVAVEFLYGFKGYAQSDGYTGYEELGRQPGVIPLGCLAHARRKFHDVKEVSKKPGSAHEALAFISKLYAIEKKGKALSSEEEVYALRQRESKPILENFKRWLERKREQTPPRGLLGKAIQYSLGQWDRLARYIEDGMLLPDNNLAENAIRPFVIGRRNWLFYNTPAGANASAVFYSLIETAKANGLEPYWFLRHVFEHITEARTEQDYRLLLPQTVSEDTSIRGPT